MRFLHENDMVEDLDEIIILAKNGESNESNDKEISNERESLESDEASMIEAVVWEIRH